MTKTYETVLLSKLIPYANNPRKNDDAVPAVEASIEQVGYITPIVVDENYEVLAGHTRLKALNAMGTKEAEVLIVEGLTDEEKRKYRILDNKTGDFAEWDVDLLEVELADLDFGDFDFGFDIEMDDPVEIIEDEAPEPPEEPKTKLGDIYQLGQHRLICGDCTYAETLDALMDGNVCDCVFTDPPYGISIVNDKGKVGAGNLAKNRTYSKVIADDTTETAEQAYYQLNQICDKLIMWGGNYFLDFLPPSDGWLIWDKRIDMTSNNFADGEMAWCSFHTPVRIYHQLWNGMIREGEHENRVHPTQKPVRMLGEILKDFTSEGDIVVDVFGGSGSTLIACEQLNRKCYMCELDERYCDVIVQRWENFTGQKAVLL